MILRATDVELARQGTRIIQPCSLELKSGEILLLLGPSGAGKTTLLRLLSYLDEPDRGTVTIMDDAEKPIEIRKWPTVSMVFQQHFLWPHLNVEQNISLGANIPPDKLIDLIEELELAGLLRRLPNQLSVGQKQRVSLARGIACNPCFLLLDEITAALDVEWCSRLVVFLSRLASEGKGLAIVTHQIGFARNLVKCNSQTNIMFIECGRVEERGSAAVLDKPASPRFEKFLSLI